MSESHVLRRQIMTYKDGPRAETANIIVDICIYFEV